MMRWYVRIYPVRESSLIITETYDTEDEAHARLKAVTDAMMRKGDMVWSTIPERDVVMVINGSMIVGATMFKKEEEE